MRPQLLFLFNTLGLVWLSGLNSPEKIIPAGNLKKQVQNLGILFPTSGLGENSPREKTGIPPELQLPNKPLLLKHFFFEDFLLLKRWLRKIELYFPKIKVLLELVPNCMFLSNLFQMRLSRCFYPISFLCVLFLFEANQLVLRKVCVLARGVDFLEMLSHQLSLLPAKNKKLPCSQHNNG